MASSTIKLQIFARNLQSVKLTDGFVEKYCGKNIRVPFVKTDITNMDEIGLGSIVVASIDYRGKTCDGIICSVAENQDSTDEDDNNKK